MAWSPRDLAHRAQHDLLRAASDGEHEGQRRDADDAAEHHEDRAQRIAAAWT